MAETSYCESGWMARPRLSSLLALSLVSRRQQRKQGRVVFLRLVGVWPRNKRGYPCQCCFCCVLCCSIGGCLVDLFNGNAAYRLLNMYNTRHNAKDVDE